MSSKNVTMKVLLVSFFNDEAYGMRVIHSNLVNNDIDAHMLFFKMPYRRHRSLVFYINCISTSQITQEQKNDIYELINDYKNSKDIRAIKNVVEPYLRVRTH